MRSVKTLLLIVASISFISVIGGSIYEHLAVVPQWSKSPPGSLTMFQGDYGLNAGKFWQIIHPLTLVLWIASLIANWKTKRRKYISISLGVYVVILIITANYFVPELLSIITTKFEATVNPELVSRAKLWEKLSIARLIVIIGAAGILLYSLTVSSEKYKSTQLSTESK